VSLCYCIDDRKPQTDSTLSARPSRVGSREALENPIDRVLRDPGALIGDPNCDLTAAGDCRELDRVGNLCVLDGVLEQRVECVSQHLWIGAKGPDRQRSQTPGALRGRRPANEDVLEEGLDIDVRPRDEVGVISLGEE
jgi:hypothetical protein